jgi:hypothetical protein
MALGSTQPLAEMSTRNLPGGKGTHVVYNVVLNSVAYLRHTRNVTSKHVPAIMEQ